ncbi:MAG: hypothetical protein HY554_01905 [Elusimicrobia bacterium]|nr:hypothetical protein [Elusimicrobiota bacterium]
MAIRKPSALKPALAVAGLLALLFALRDRREPPPPDWRSFAGPSSVATWLTRPRAPEASPPGPGPRGAGAAEADARDAVGGAAAASGRGGGLRPPAATDWSAVWGDRFFEVTAVRREKDGRVVRSRTRLEPPVQSGRRSAAPAEGPARPAPGARPAWSPGAQPSAAARAAPGSRRAAAAGAERVRTVTVYARDAAPGRPGRAGAPRFERMQAASSGRIGAMFRQFKERYLARRRGGKLPRISLKALLGRGPLRPPAGTLVAPDFSKLGPAPAPPDGGRIDPKEPLPAEVEGLAPPDAEPDYKDWSRHPQFKAPHWHRGKELEYFHRGSDWGLRWSKERWAWMIRAGRYWWTQGGALPLVRNQEHWWWRTEDGWFLLHQGQPWAYRFFTDLRRDGLFDPKTRVRIVYSWDAKRIAIIIPDRETIVYDARTGEELGRIPAAAGGEDG